MPIQTRLFVGNLPDATSENDLRSAFSAYGEVTNLDLKTKAADDDKRNFAFVTLSSTPEIVESCINHFGQNSFKGQKLYVTRARESFLERLQRERQEEEAKKSKHTHQDGHKHQPDINPVINLGEKLNPRKRKVDNNDIAPKKELKNKGHKKSESFIANTDTKTENVVKKSFSVGSKDKFKADHKKEDADKKRMDSIRKKRQEFKEKQTIIKTGLLGIDKVKNKKIIFSDDETPHDIHTDKAIHAPVKDHKKVIGDTKKTKKALLDDGDDSGDEINFEIKKQFKGKSGQKVLELQSRYKSDKQMGPEDEKNKQLDILQDVLGVAIRRPPQEQANNKKIKTKLGMPRFDPNQPDHAKFLAPVEEKEELTKKSKKKKKDKTEEISKPEPVPQAPVPEVSKEQFYKVSETLKEAIAQPTTFSLRSLFGNVEEDNRADDKEQDTGFISLEKPKDLKKKVKNPLEPTEKNPFVYDSSDSEDEGKEEEVKQDPAPVVAEVKAVWKENLFFTKSDHRLQEGLEFFNKTSDNEVHKERRELKSLMKKRIYNKERKNQMFQKKIGGRKKTMKKTYRNKT
ncbi:RNA recognition motif domain-containing protein [Phthorimaea operculella]|nr:RNA recognition motif domain-containing protein [Phthorimaea operculella]